MSINNNTSEILIVGNGSSLLNSNLGDIIDSYTHVVRFNRFSLDSHEPNVGTKTTIWFTGVNYVNKSSTDAIRYNKIVQIYLHSWVKAEQFDIIRNVVTQSSSTCELIKVDHNIMDELCEFMQNKSYRMWSTGAIAVWILLKRFKSVDIVGFDWWEQNIRHHYMDSENFIYYPNKGHQPFLEKQFFDLLAAKKQLKYISL
ncbi:MAG: glycosyltransferase family 29 protein [bacterium]